MKSPAITPEEFFEENFRKFQKARELSKERTERDYYIASRRVRLIFCNGALVPFLSPAFAHLGVPLQGKADLTILFWDSHSTGISLGSPPWKNAQGGAVSFNGDRCRILFNFGSGSLYSFDPERSLGIFWTKNSHSVPYFESGAPLLPIIHWWLSKQSLQLMHAGAIGLREGGVLLVGKGGSGKSTTCLSTIFSNLSYAGDDYCLVDSGARPYVHSMYNSSKIRPDMLPHFSHLMPELFNPQKIPEEKPTFFLWPKYSEKIVSGFPLKAVLIPQVVSQNETSLRPATAMEGLRALAPSTIFQLPGFSETVFRKATELVKKIPCFHLLLGKKIGESSTKIENFLNHQLLGQTF